MRTFFDLVNHVKKNMVPENFLAFIKDGKSFSISYKDFIERIENISSFLSSIGFKKDSKLVIMMDSSPAWLLIDLASIKAGGISVPMFSNLSFENMIFQLQNCEAEYIAVQDEEVFEIIKKTGHYFKQIITVNTFDADFLEKNKGYNIISLEEASKQGMQKLSETSRALGEIERTVNETDLATIIYTSGTSGRPKGVELTHKNLISQLDAAELGLDKNEDSVFSFLPLAHIFQRTLSYHFLSKCLSMHFSSDLKTIADDLERTKPAATVVVPRFLEKVKNGLNEKIKAESSFIKRFIGRICYNYASKHEPTIPHNKILYKIFDKLMYSKVRLKLGGKLQAMICGGASLPDEVFRFFLNIGVPLYQGYGLTETSPIVTASTILENKVYTVGKPIKNVEIKLSPEKELLIRGPNVMRGYHKIDSEGARAIDKDGFLYTGDLAEIDSEGYVKIIGRKKEQFKTSNGKFINPVRIESMLNSIPYIETSCIVAENKPFCIAILFPNDAGVLKLEDVKASIPSYIAKINDHLDHQEQIHHFHVHNKPASIETGHITPSMKVIRAAIEKQFKDKIEEFYS